ncbi:periplasmic heavy metal sensor [Acetobacteraceae bacterium H6797]|nr:periplasmic heavy metal sensor [Acetobacteraceae bacterium H6797]
MRFSRSVFWRVVLGASLMLNIALIADKAVHEARPAQPGRERGLNGMLARMEASLPEADRTRFRAGMERQRDRYLPALEAMRAARPAVDQAVRQSPFDPEKLRSASAAWADRWHEFSIRYGEAVAEALKDISPEGRAALARADQPPAQQK